jgi:hypothetical protein
MVYRDVPEVSLGNDLTGDKDEAPAGRKSTASLFEQARGPASMMKDARPSIPCQDKYMDVRLLEYYYVHTH